MLVTGILAHTRTGVDAEKLVADVHLGERHDPGQGLHEQHLPGLLCTSRMNVWASHENTAGEDVQSVYDHTYEPYTEGGQNPNPRAARKGAPSSPARRVTRVV